MIIIVFIIMANPINFLNDMKNIDSNYIPGIRDNFIAKIASEIKENSSVIDICSGNKPYEKLFKHCKYVSHEFPGNKNIIDSFRQETSIEHKKHDIISPIDNIPKPDNSFDFVICTEVFEHIPEPIKAMEELVRICKPNGKILITAPFTSGIHQEPYHFYSGFSPFFYNFLKDKFNLKILQFKSQGDMFLLNHQEIGRCLSHKPSAIIKTQDNLNILNLCGSIITKYLLNLSSYYSNSINNTNTPENMMNVTPGNRFTLGYCVLYSKM